MPVGDFVASNPDKALATMRRYSVLFAGDQLFGNYWNPFLQAIKGCQIGIEILEKGAGVLTPERIERLHQRLEYDYSAMRIAATSLVYLLVENDEHETNFREGIGAINQTYEAVAGSNLNQLWELPSPQLQSDTATETPPKNLPG